MNESKFYRFFSPLVPKRLRLVFLRYQEYISYLVFGVLTTLVNFIIYYPMSRVVHYLAANVIAWLGAVIFAYITNRCFVFESQSQGIRAILYEISTFFAARLMSLGLEEGILFLMVDRLSMNEDLVKLFAQVLVILFNYFASKLVIFRKSS